MNVGWTHGSRLVRVARWAVAASAVLFTSPAWAEPSASDRAIAVTLFHDGKELAARGSTAEACAKFTESHRLDPKIGSLLHVATCHELEGRTTSAWLAFTEVAAMAARAKQADREKLAHDKVRALEPVLSKLVVTAPAATPGLEVKLDGTIVGEGALGMAVPVDPGAHEITASAPSRKGWSRKLTVPRGPTTLSIAVPHLADEDAPPPLASELVAPATTSPPVAPVDIPSSAPRMVGWALVATSAVSLGVGTVFGLRAASESSDAKRVCPDQTCPTGEGVRLHDSAKTSALVSTVGFGVGIVAAVSGLYLILTSRSNPPASRSARFQLMPRFAPNGGGLDATVGF